MESFLYCLGSTYQSIFTPYSEKVNTGEYKVLDNTVDVDENKTFKPYVCYLEEAF